MEKISNIDSRELFPNASPGQPEVFVCLLCQDTGWIIQGDSAAPCSCRHQRRLSDLRRRSGLSPALSRHRLEKFELRYYPEYLRVVENGKTHRQLAQQALAAAKNFAAGIRQGLPVRSLLFEGEVGRGKTYLAAAIANALLDAGIDVLFLVVPEFLDEMRYSYQEDNQDYSEADLMPRAQKAPVLILDDFGAHNFSEWTKNKIFTLINYRLNHQLPIIITTNKSIDSLAETIGSRTVSRIVEMCDFFLLCSKDDLRRIIK
ncbi:MAG: ATP-binding protein [Clostridiales bacterium]|jgi:DNA replication protein DnaC|nr:ATP-binding protein [Clostridiales bacterium]MDR2711944.1 ATP-binding protein [Clostridiales bacterium]